MQPMEKSLPNGTHQPPARLRHIPAILTAAAAPPPMITGGKALVITETLLVPPSPWPPYRSLGSVV